MTMIEFETEDQIAGREMKRGRLKLGLSQAEMAMMLGYKGENLQLMQQYLESGKRTIREPQKRLMQAYLDGYRPDDWVGR